MLKEVNNNFKSSQYFDKYKNTFRLYPLVNLIKEVILYSKLPNKISKKLPVRRNS